MRIALVSYELPPATGGGGIGTYLVNLVPALLRAGLEVEVFSGAGSGAEGSVELLGTTVHRHGQDVSSFRDAIGEQIANRHRERPFDVAEAPEYLAQAGPIHRSCPDLPIVVKLHTPTFVVNRLNYERPTVSRRLRWIAGALKRGAWPEPYPSLAPYRPDDDPEAIEGQLADQISSPSDAVWNVVSEAWKLSGQRRFDVPLPFLPDDRLLKLSVERSTSTILFLGRLEGRKGIVELARALPEVLRSRPNVRMRFVGSPHPSPDGRGTFADWIRRKLSRFANQLEILPAVRPDQLPEVFGACDVAVFPSRWESFGYVCLEAMAAGCGVVASRHGGMAEIVEDGISGLVVDPSHSQSLSAAISRLIDSPAERLRLASAARERVLSVYAPSVLIDRYIEGYQAAIASRFSQPRSNDDWSRRSTRPALDNRNASL